MDHKKKKHKYRSRSRDRSRERRTKDRYAKSSSDSDSDYHRSKSRSKKSKKKKRDRSDSRERKSSRHKGRRRDYSQSESSDDSDSSSHRDKQKTSKMNPRDLQLLKEEKRRQKELIKATETPEEKRARRLAKKEAKERKRKEKMGWDQEYMGYTNADNPFGDEHLLDTFVWSKKIDKEGKKHLTHDVLQDEQKKKMEENRRELEKVKKRRQEREKEFEEREREREQLQRDKEAEYFREWEKQEDTFHLHQAKMRSEIRIQDGRAKPIDLLAKYISAEDDELSVEMHEPYTYLYGLTMTDLEDLLEDIKVYLELEQGKNADYWRDIITVTEDELKKLRKHDATTRDFCDRREGINESVNEEVVQIFKGKTTNQLIMLENEIAKKLSGGEGVDVGYWESLLSQLKAHMARTRLRERHQDVLRQKLFKLKQEQGIQGDPLFPAGAIKHGSPHVQESQSRGVTPPVKSDQSKQDTEEPQAGSSKSGETAMEEASSSGEVPQSSDNPAAVINQPEQGEDAEVEEEEVDEDEQNILDYKAGSYSPRLLRPQDLEIDTVVYDPEDDIKKLMLAREQVRFTGQVRLDGETEFEKKAREGMNDEEAQFSVQVPVEAQAFLWSDKYRPRKPRFFNRVHTGFEWNKYNQTHYDIDNPPPKIVQGYKFNIFYPDLIDKAKTPEYTLTPLPENKDFGVLKFHAGAPYEDIAFKVVNREWEFSHKRGFRCQFSNNIFQLWYHFKRYRYRR